MSRLSTYLWHRLCADVENYIPLAAAYAVSMTLWGLVMLLEHGLEARDAYSLYGEGGTYAFWAWMTFALGLAQTASLLPSMRRFLLATSIAAVFVWSWIALAFLLSMGMLSTAQAMYVPATLASMWLAFRTAPLS